MRQDELKGLGINDKELKIFAFGQEATSLLVMSACSL